MLRLCQLLKDKKGTKILYHKKHGALAVSATDCIGVPKGWKTAILMATTDRVFGTTGKSNTSGASSLYHLAFIADALFCELLAVLVVYNYFNPILADKTRPRLSGVLEVGNRKINLSP